MNILGVTQKRFVSHFLWVGGILVLGEKQMSMLKMSDITPEDAINLSADQIVAKYGVAHTTAYRAKAKYKALASPVSNQDIMATLLVLINKVESMSNVPSV